MTHSDQLTVAELSWIDDRCAAFESALKSGDAPSIEASLEHMDDPPRSSESAKRLRSALLRELVTLEIAYRGQTESVRADDYLKRFPQDHELVHAVLQNTPSRHPALDGASPNTMENPHEKAGDSVMEKKPEDDLSTFVPADSSAGSAEGSRLTARDSEGFLSKLNQMGVLSQDEINALNRTIASGESRSEPRHVATKLVEQGKLTEYQASALLDGQPELLIDKYLILDLLDAGGMGMVFKAIHRPMNRTVAVKMIAQHLLASPEQVKRFQREVRVAATLEHPNVVRAYDADKANGVHFLVMEYVRGENLAKVVRRDGPFSLERAVDAILQSARGLSYAHKQGVIHRDIKPGNLMLTNDGQVKVLDLGLANMDESFRRVQQSSVAQAEHDVDRRTSQMDLTTAGTPLGTVAFMAPEQSLDAHHADARSDIYSLGCTFYFLLTGEHPFKGDSVFQIFLQHREGPIPELHEFRPDVPESIEVLIRRMLAKDPNNRHQSMDDLITEIEACAIASPERDRSQTQEDRPSLGTQPTPEKETTSRSVTRRRGRRLALWGFVGLACVVALMFAVSRIWLPSAHDADDKHVVTAESADGDRGPQSDGSVVETTDESVMSAADLLATAEYEWRIEENLGAPVNTGNQEPGADMTADGLILVFQGQRSFGGSGRSDIWMVTRESIEDSWSVAVNLGESINTADAEQVPDISEDGRTLVFSRQATGQPARTLYSTRSSVDAPWSHPRPHAVNRLHQQGATMSSDGLTLLVQRAGDLLLSRRSSEDSPWPSLESVGPRVNSPQYERYGTISADGRLLIFSRGETHTPDLWIATRSGWEAPWSEPVLLEALNSSGIEQAPKLIADGKSLLFASDRPGGEGGMDIWLARLVRKDAPRNETPGGSEGSEEQVVQLKIPQPDGFGLEFNGDGDYVQLPFLGYDGKSPLTIEFSYEAPHRQVPNAACLSIDGLVWIQGSPDSKGWQLAGRSGDQQFHKGDAPATQLIGSRTHLATVYDGDDISIFLDGKKQNVKQMQLITGEGSSEIDTVRFSPTHRMKGANYSLLGGIYASGSAKFSGTIDEIRISMTARYTEDYSLANRLEADEHTLALYHFDEGQGDVLSDSSGNEHHGKIVGPTWVRLDGQPVDSALEEPKSELPKSSEKTTPANKD